MIDLNWVAGAAKIIKQNGRREFAEKLKIDDENALRSQLKLLRVV